MAENEDKVLLFIPSLVATLLNRENAKGTPLTEEEVIAIRDSAPCVTVPPDVAAKMEMERGYSDLDPENCWVEWQQARQDLKSDERDEPRFMALRDKDLTAVVQRAQETFDFFKRAFQQDSYSEAFHLVKARFVDQSDGETVAHLWLGVTEIADDSVQCVTFEVPTGFKGLRDGQVVTLTYDAVEDWMINDRGRLYGGFSIRVQREHTPEKERESFDRYVGITEYKEELP
jgi:uncharacterized protein YegJ (DUF2314 family)